MGLLASCPLDRVPPQVMGVELVGAGATDTAPEPVRPVMWRVTSAPMARAVSTPSPRRSMPA